MQMTGDSMRVPCNFTTLAVLFWPFIRVFVEGTDETAQSESEFLNLRIREGSY